MRKQQHGYIIMISSLSGIAGLPGDVAYAASKFALEGATEALRHEVDRWGIKLALVEAGMYATGIFARSPYRNNPRCRIITRPIHRIALLSNTSSGHCGNGYPVRRTPEP